MRAQFTQYAVPGWGTGELWIGGGLLLTHEFRFHAVSDTVLEPQMARAGADSAGREGGRASHDRTERTAERASGDPSCGAIGTRSARVSLDRKRCLTPNLLIGLFTTFLEGDEVSFDDVPIDLEWATAFQRDVGAAIRALPRGEVASYGELAALAGYPGAARAVGTFCAHNRFMFVVPCHRVVGSSGIGGYGSAGVETKRRLLALEGVAL